MVQGNGLQTRTTVSSNLTRFSIFDDLKFKIVVQYNKCASGEIGSTRWFKKPLPKGLRVRVSPGAPFMNS